MKKNFTDQLGRTLSVSFPPQRIVSLVPSQTELLAYLGLEEETVGITKFCVLPERWFRSKARIGGTKKVNLEKITALQPGLIIGNKEENTKEQIEALAEQFPVWLSDVKTLESALDMIERVGEITGRYPAAAQLAGKIREQFDALEQDLAGKRRLRAAYFIWREPYYVAGGDTFINDMLHRSGFNNLFGHRERYPEVSLEALAEAQPEAILLSSEPYPFREKHREAFRLACPTATVEFVDGQCFSWYGSHLLSSTGYFRKARQAILEAQQTL